VSSASAAWNALPARRRWALPARWRNPIGLVGAAIVGTVVLTAAFGDLLWRTDPNNPVYDRFLTSSWDHPMGTDELGRDTFARIIHGAQVSLQVGAVAISIAFVGGTLIGLLAGYYRGRTDLALMRLVDLMFAFPGLVLAFLIVGLLGPTRTNAMIAVGIIIMPAFARVVRASVLEVMGMPFMESARGLGAGDLRIMLRHVIPNIVAPLIVLTTVYFSVAILAEATLSFLGLGTQPPEAAWGNMLATARTYIDASVWVSVWPGAAIMITVLGFNLLGDGLRDILDPRLGGGVANVAAAQAKDAEAIV
jgi:peptide/nickel transport system permease protein